MSPEPLNHVAFLGVMSEYRANANQYYQTSEFMEKFGILLQLINSVREELSKLTIAVDIEGTLVSLNMALSYNMNIHPLNRVRRPLANELLVLLERYSKKTFLWTGGIPERITPILESSQLCIPRNVEKIHREDYGNRLRLPEHEALLSDPSIGHYARYAARRGLPKFPHIMGADILIDDFAQQNIHVLATIGPGEVKKVIDVSSFTIDNEEQLARHHLDTGLIDATRTMVERIKN